MSKEKNLKENKGNLMCDFTVDGKEYKAVEHFEFDSGDGILYLYSATFEESLENFKSISIKVI